jgi:hypothetical protein
MPRFVVLEHDHPDLHWDLMLEVGAMLRTWRLAAPPEPGRSIAAEPLADHRLAYLDYEGPVSGNRGRVRRWDHGEFSPALEGPPAPVVVQLRGQRLCGTATLSRGDGEEWSFLLTGPS